MREGWEYKPLGDIGKISMCKRILKKQTNSTSGIPFYKIGTFGKVANAYIPQEIYQEFKKNYSFPHKGDILISASGTIGRRVVYDGKPAYFQDSNIVWIANDESLITNDYLYAFYGYCDWNPSKGATISRLYNADLRRIVIPIPPIKEQKQIVAILDKVFTAIEQAKGKIEKNIQNAKELFQSKLNEIFSQKGDGWEEKKFKDICVLQRGFDLPKRLRIKGKFDLVTSSGIKDSHNEYKVNPPGVVTGRSGSIGKIFYITNKFWPLNTALYIKDFNENNEKYIYYFLMNFDLSKYSTGTGVPTLNRNFVHDELVMSNNSIEIQKSIVKELDSLNLKTNFLKKQFLTKIKNLEELKKSILQKAFAGELTRKVGLPTCSV